MGLRIVNISILLWLFSTLLLVPAADATIYTFVDENGVIHFSNVPNDPNYQPVVNLRPRIFSQTGPSRVLIPDGADWQPTPDSYDDIIRSAANRYQVDPRLIKAVIRAESNFDYLAVSRKGAMGLMQLMPLTAADMQVNDPFDPIDNVNGGTRYLRKMLGLFNGNLRMSLAAYNAGPSRVINLGRVPHLRETHDYVRKVQYFYKEYRESSSPSKRWAKVFYDHSS